MQNVKDPEVAGLWKFTYLENKTFNFLIPTRKYTYHNICLFFHAGSFLCSPK